MILVYLRVNTFFHRVVEQTLFFVTLCVNAQINVSCVQARALPNNKNIFYTIFVHAVVRDMILFRAISTILSIVD